MKSRPEPSESQRSEPHMFESQPFAQREESVRR